MLETTIICPLPAETSDEERRKYRAVYERIRIAVHRIDHDQQASKKCPATPTGCQPINFNQFLSQLDLTWPGYLLGLRTSVQKATILYKRNIDAIRRNAYNPKLLNLQNSNIDAQFDWIRTLQRLT
jgi:hypothetical protein